MAKPAPNMQHTTNFGTRGIDAVLGNLVGVFIPQVELEPHLLECTRCGQAFGTHRKLLPITMVGASPRTRADFAIERHCARCWASESLHIVRFSCGFVDHCPFAEASVVQLTKMDTSVRTNAVADRFLFVTVFFGILHLSKVICSISALGLTPSTTTARATNLSSI